MHSPVKSLPVVALTAMTSIIFTLTCVFALACLQWRDKAAVGSEPDFKAACETIRRGIRQDVLTSFGYDSMIERMARISRQLTADEREDLNRFTSVLDSSNASPKLQALSSKKIKSIYGDAIERSGLRLGVSELRPDIQKKITAEPTGSAPLFDGHTVVLGSAPSVSGVAPAQGELTDAFLATNADQSHYELILVRAKSVSPGPHGGFEVDGEYVTLNQYIRSKEPSYCAPIGSL